MKKESAELAFVVVAIFFIGLIYSVSASNILTVCPTGCDYNIIQMAVNNANNTDTILVFNSTYNEHVTIDEKYLTLKSYNSSINCGGNGIGILLNTNNSIADGFEIKNCDYGIKIYGSNNKIVNNNIHDNSKGIIVLLGDNSINFNSIYGNSVYNLKNSYSLQANASYNWWGDCNGPQGSDVQGNVIVSPWLGACINNKALNKNCVIENDSIILQANVSSLVCIGKVIFEVYLNNSWQNLSGVLSFGNWNYIKNINNIPEHQTIKWKVYAEDCYGYGSLSDTSTFNVKARTKLFIIPQNPDGLNNWYISRPLFILDNTDATKIFYRWDSSDNLVYINSFGLENTPNNANVSGGILHLNYWSDVCNESLQKKIIYIDFSNPWIKFLQPINRETIADTKPIISAYIDDIWLGNSGINKTSIVMKVDGELVDANINSPPRDKLDANVSYKPITDLSKGTHNVYIFAKDNSGRFSEINWSFNITAPENFNLTIHSPINSIFNKKRIKFNMTTIQKIKKIDYINYNDKKPIFKILCNNCNEYGFFRDKYLTFNEGENNIKIRAADIFDNTKENNLTIFVDSQVPSVSKILPDKNSIINGSKFYIKYSEINLKNITLILRDISNDIGQISLMLNSCDAGINKECRAELDLSNYNGKEIEYYFVISDYFNTIISKKTRVKVDTISPVITVNKPNQNESYLKKVPFKINSSENVNLEYMDDSEPKPKWVRLCSNCNGFGNSKIITKSFKTGLHDLFIKATDKAGNSDIKEILVNVI